MDRTTIRAVTLTVVGIVALALAAATLSSPVTDPGGGAGNATGGPVPISVGETDAAPNPVDVGVPAVVAVIVVVAVVLSAVLYVVTETGEAVRLLATLAVLIGLVLLLVFAMSLGGQSSEGERGGLLDGVRSGLSSGDGTGNPVMRAPQWAVLLLGVGFLLVVGIAVAYATTGDAVVGPESALDADASEAEGDPNADAASDVGRTAGRAADRIESDADVENEVYRAWREMTDHLDVPNPAASTPGEFAAAARDAGMDPAAVDDLTGLFEEVRYGGTPVTEDREERAVETLRRVEASTPGEE